MVKTIMPMIPNHITTILSPFVGGGTIEINLACHGYKVHAYDNYLPLIQYWKLWMTDPTILRDKVYEILSLYDHHELNRIKKGFGIGTEFNELESASFYYIFNRLVFNGLPTSKINPFYYDRHGEILRRTSYKGFPKGEPIFKNWKFWRTCPIQNYFNMNHAEFQESLHLYPDSLAYLDPPYIGREKHYAGSMLNGFDHVLLANLIQNRPNTIISYNDHPLIWDMYSEFYIERIHRGTATSDGKTELLIISQDLLS